LKTLGVLLAGGAGTRLRTGAPKALAMLAGATLLERALATLRACCDDVVVAAPASLALPVPAAMRADDQAGAAGPLAGVVAGLCAREYDRAFVLGVDFPLVRSGFLLALGERLQGGALAVLPAPDARVQPLVAAYAPGARAPLAAALRDGRRALVPEVLALPHELVDDAALARMPGGRAGLLNVNTQKDLAEAVRLLAQEGAA
jgi:molybdopterin-guanine dinucleotide biosynthesis protein A